MGTASSSHNSESTGRWRWLWILPRLAFMLFVGGVALLLWISERIRQEERRATLISDVLWLEQNLRFHLIRNEELLGRIDRPNRQRSEVLRVLCANPVRLRKRAAAIDLAWMSMVR
jgi:hypothetical protein